MKGSGRGIVFGLAFEFAPAVIFGSAVAFSCSTMLALPRFDLVPLSVGIGAFAASWLVLRRFGAAPKSLPMTDFDQSDLERELTKLAEEMQSAEPIADRVHEESELEELILEDEFPPATDDELLLEDELSPATDDLLLLEDEITSGPGESRVIRLFDPRTQTAGEMQERIEHHLRTTPRPPLSDATQELHEALSALRQSMR